MPRGNVRRYTTRLGNVDKADEGFVESNLMHSVDGYVRAYLLGLMVKVGEPVRWSVMGMGAEVGLLTLHLHGQALAFNGMRIDMVEPPPVRMQALDMRPDPPGRWLGHCHVNDHLGVGMQEFCTVQAWRPRGRRGTGRVRRIRLPSVTVSLLWT